VLRLPPLALYVHLPWCERKCPYCDFNSYQSTGAPPFEGYVTRLLQDLEGESVHSAGRDIQSVFIGGGTPSLFPQDSLARLLGGIGDHVMLADDAEITLEANPGSAEAAKFSALRAAGVNRLSIGIQSFNDASLRALGRVHDSRQALAAVDAARSAGFERFNIDLMHGLPGQTVAMALEDLEQALALQPPHLSWYQLTLEPNTAFHRSPPTLPVEDLLAEIQDRGEELLLAHGYEQYEVSAWARPGHACRHNLNYWQFGDYIGIGAGAHGKLTLAPGRAIMRTRKTRAPQDYLDGGGAPVCHREAVAEDELVLEFLMNALRLREGVPIALFEQRTGLSRDRLEPMLHSLREEGLMQAQEDRLGTTAQGFRFLNLVLQRF
jgi:putative oxygen-independent coproporphyrinogen III oxidase